MPPKKLSADPGLPVRAENLRLSGSGSEHRRLQPDIAEYGNTDVENERDRSEIVECRPRGTGSTRGQIERELENESMDGVGRPTGCDENPAGIWRVLLN